MTEREMARTLYAEIVEGNLAEYRRILAEAVTTPPRDSYWRKVVELYKSLPDERKEDFVAIFRQVTVDAVSSVTGVLDGTIQLAGNFQPLSLVDSAGTRLNGMLQDHFLARDEETRAR